MAQPNTVRIWSGASLLDGSPISVFVSGLSKRSKNAKTGDMLQAWILRSDVDPLRAIQTGADVSICGDCPHRGFVDVDGKLRERSCYVSVKNAPLSVFRSFVRGGIPTASVASIAHKLSGRKVRIGAYGDPAAVPVAVWQLLSDYCAGITGYTHQWRTTNLQRFVMASADSVSDQLAARARGYRVFRVKLDSEPLMAGEISCPASDEAGKRTTCEACGLCNGVQSGAREQRRNIAINVHGIGVSSFVKLSALRVA